MPNIIGSNSNNFLFFQGTLQQYSTTIYNPYSGDSFFVAEDEKNVNNSTYDGRGGYDTLFLSDFGDVLYADSSVGPANIGSMSVATQLVTSIERIIAGDGGDVIVTASTNFSLGDTTIDGGGADDLIWSNAGDDLIHGRAGDDVIDGGPGNDLIYGDEGSDTISGGDGADYLSGGDGNDTLVFQPDIQFDSIYGASIVGSPDAPDSGPLYMVGGTNGSTDTFDGGAGYDTVQLTNGNDTFFLTNANYEYNENSGPVRLVDVEQINAGAGNDIVDLTHGTYTYGDIVIHGGNGDDHLWSSVGNDTLYGENGYDDLYGGIGNDTLYGGAGNDILRGGPAGGAGVLQVTETPFEFHDNVLFPDLVERTDIYNLDPPRGDALGIVPGDLAVSYETTATITFLESGAGYHNSLGVYNIAADGTIQSVQMAFTDVHDYAPGTEYNVALPGAPDTDFGFFIVANGANKNHDYSKMDLDHGEFRFVYDYGHSDERAANITDGEDDIKLVFYGDDGSEHVIVGSNNHIYHTTDRGGPTNLNGDSADHVVSGLTADGDNSTLRIGFEDLPNLGDADYNDVVFDVNIGSQTTETLLVNDNDILYGGAGNDTLDGGVGDDILNGGTGADLLHGGQGADTFVFDNIDGHVDTIDDFELGNDKLDIADILQGYDAVSDAISDFVQVTHNSAGATEIAVNADGSAGGTYQAVAVITGGLAANETLADMINHGAIVAEHAA